MNVKLFILSVINFVLIFIALLMIAGCMHDNKVLRGYNEQVRQSVIQLRQEAERT